MTAGPPGSAAASPSSASCTASFPGSGSCSMPSCRRSCRRSSPTVRSTATGLRHCRKRLPVAYALAMSASLTSRAGGPSSRARSLGWPARSPAWRSAAAWPYAGCGSGPRHWPAFLTCSASSPSAATRCLPTSSSTRVAGAHRSRAGWRSSVSEARSSMPMTTASCTTPGTSAPPTAPSQQPRRHPSSRTTR